MNEQERKEFERWYEGHCLPGEADWFRRDPDEPDEYKHGHTSEAWAGWQARAALAAKVPAGPHLMAKHNNLHMNHIALKAQADKLARALHTGLGALICAGSNDECQSLEVYAKQVMREALAAYDAPAPAPEATQFRGARRRDAAEATLQRLGYQWRGGVLWKPPLGAAPAQAQQAAEPLPCPFCGHVGLDFADGSTHRWGLASCAGCGATCGETRRAYPPDDKWHASAIKDWNTRAKPEAQPLTAMQARSVVDGMGWALDEVEIEDMEMLVKAAERACAEAWGVKLGASGEK